MDGFELEQGEYGLKAVLCSRWSPSIAEALKSAKITGMELNYAKGWAGLDISFLAEFPNLLSLELTNYRIQNIEPIHFLGALRELRVATFCKSEIRFSEFKYLEKCTLEWRAKAKSVFDCTSLTELMINKYQGYDVDPFSNLTNLESIAIFSSPLTNLNGFRDLRKLRYLRLGLLRKLNSLKGIEKLSELNHLQIQTCRSIRSLSEVGNLRKMIHLSIQNCGDIDSLAPLRNLNRLEYFGFVESTNIVDGDLSPLLQLPALKQVDFKQRKHYSHNWKDFEFLRLRSGLVGARTIH